VTGVQTCALPISSAYLETTNPTVGAWSDRLALFQVARVFPSPDVATVKAYPNPFIPRKGHTSMTFADLPAEARLELLSLTGERLRNWTTDSFGTAVWDGKNESGENVASGVYLLRATANGQEKTIKLAVQR
jgi:hypothetical protein